MMESSPAPFGTLLRRQRLAAGLSQEALAARSGLSVRGISDLERGIRRTPHPASLHLLLNSLAVTGSDRTLLIDAASDDHRLAPDHGAAGEMVRLPRPVTPLLGRKDDLGTLTAWLTQPALQLVTLTGMGGIGKTRLAIEVAHHLVRTFRDGVVFVDLAPITDPALVLSSMLSALDIAAAASQPLLPTAIRGVGDRRMLLILDNCEQVLEAAPDLAALLAACPGLKFLVTSREALHVRGEREWPLPPLPLPDPECRATPDTLAEEPAVALFAERAQAADPHFAVTTANAAAVVEICHRVEGIPLGIELAASRVKLLGLNDLAQKLDHRLPLLTAGARDAPARQRTLRDALAWSFDLLSPDDQRCFRRLGVFVGGWTLDAAIAVTGPPDEASMLDRLGSLLDKNLIRVAAAGSETRYSMLETMREFASERLRAEDEASDVLARHAAHFLDVGVRGARALQGRDQRLWLARLEREHPNVRQALATLDEQGEYGGYVTLTTALWMFWFLRTHAREGLVHCERALRLTPEASGERALSLNAAGSLAYALGRYADAEAWLQESATLARQHGDLMTLAQATLTQGVVAEHLGHEAAAQAHFEAGLAIARERDHAWLIGQALPQLSDAAYRRGDLEAADAYAREAHTVLQATGNAYMEAINLGNLAQVALARGELRAAADAIQAALTIAVEIDTPWNVANGIGLTAAVGAERRQFDLAAQLLGAAEKALERSGHPRHLHFSRFAETQASVCDAIGEAAYQVAWAMGWAMATEEALAAAHAMLASAREAPKGDNG